MTRSIRPVRGQHTVTKRILKEFASPQGQLAVYDRERSQRLLRTPGAGIFKTEFDRYDSRGAEERWNLFENSFPNMLQTARSRTALLSADTVSTIKDLLALHWTRSRGIMTARTAMTAQIVEKNKQWMLTAKRDVLARGLREETGLVPASDGALEWINDRAHERVVLANEAKWHSDRDLVNFAAARAHFEAFEVQIGYASGRDFIISDCPVITTLAGRRGVGPHQGVAIKEADHVAMPIAPDIIVGLGPDAKLVDVDEGAVGWYNDCQWAAYDQWIVARPDGSGDLCLRSAAALAAMPRLPQKDGPSGR